MARSRTSAMSAPDRRSRFTLVFVRLWASAYEPSRTRLLFYCFSKPTSSPRGGSVFVREFSFGFRRRLRGSFRGTNVDRGIGGKRGTVWSGACGRRYKTVPASPFRSQFDLGFPGTHCKQAACARETNRQFPVSLCVRDSSLQTRLCVRESLIRCNSD